VQLRSKQFADDETPLPLEVWEAEPQEPAGDESFQTISFRRANLRRVRMALPRPRIDLVHFLS
jgi:hypothetical protein